MARVARRTSAYDQIKQIILAGDLPEGAVLVERELGEQLGVSRVPVREALIRLSTEGLLIDTTSDGLVTRSYTMQDIVDLYLYREALDGLAARLFASRGSDSEKEYLGLVCDGMEQAIADKFSPAWLRRDREFHRVIIEGCRHAQLTATLERVHEACFAVRDRVLRYVLDGSSAGERTKLSYSILAEHQAMYHAIRAGDGDAAEAAARESVRNARRRLLRQYAQRNTQEVGADGQPAR